MQKITLLVLLFVITRSCNASSYDSLSSTYTGKFENRQLKIEAKIDSANHTLRFLFESQDTGAYLYLYTTTFSNDEFYSKYTFRIDSPNKKIIISFSPCLPYKPFKTENHKYELIHKSSYLKTQLKKEIPLRRSFFGEDSFKAIYFEDYDSLKNSYRIGSKENYRNYILSDEVNNYQISFDFSIYNVLPRYYNETDIKHYLNQDDEMKYFYELRSLQSNYEIIRINTQCSFSKLKQFCK